jgi:hypothetical protein
MGFDFTYGSAYTPSHPSTKMRSDAGKAGRSDSCQITDSSTTVHNSGVLDAAGSQIKPAGDASTAVPASLRYDDAIMMSRTQITLEPEIQRRARQRASDLGVSLAEYVRRLVSSDLGASRKVVGPSAVFDLGASGGSRIAANSIATNKDAMIAEAIAARRQKPRRRASS